MSRRIVIDAGKYLLGAGLLAYVIRANWEPEPGTGLSQVWERHIVRGEPIDGWAFAAAALLCTGSVLLTFVRWHALVRAQALPFTMGSALRLGLVGYFFNTFLPGSVGGDLVKAYGIARQQERRTVAVSTVIIDRLIGLWALAWLITFLGGGLWLAGYVPEASAAACVRIIATALGLVVTSLLGWGFLGLLPSWRADRFGMRLEKLPRIGGTAAEFWRAIWMYRKEGRTTWRALAMAVVGHVGFVLTFFLAARTEFSKEQIPTLTEHFLVIPIGMAAQAGIPTPGGVGGGELFFGWMYALLGFPRDRGVTMTLIYRVITWILGLAGYLVYLQMRPTIPMSSAEGRADAAEPAA